MNYEQTLEFIHSLGNFSKSATLERIKKVLSILGDPQNSFKSIHIAGTNGKGSVSAMLARIFTLAGYKTALFISPYIIDFRERIQVCGELIPEYDLCELAERVKKTGVELTEFEFITAVAFLYFAKQNCEVAIIETGLGGRLDATNVLENKAASVITKIGLDHTAILGDTIEKITAEKCGIIKNCPTVTSCNQPEEALSVIKRYHPIIPDKEQLEILNSDMSGNTYIYKNKKYKTSLVGVHQIENSLLVIEAIGNSGFDISYDVICKGIGETYFPARMEIISQKPLVVLDGAHNPDGAEVLSQFLKQYKGRATAVIGMMKDKDCDTVLSKTLPFCKSAVAVEVENMPRSLKADELCKLAEKYCKCETAADYDQAIERVSREDVIFVFGSLYLASAVREKLKNFFK